MKINYAKSVIELTAKEAREAEIYGSPAFLALMDAKRQLEGFTVEVKSKSKNTATFLNTYPAIAEFGMNEEQLSKWREKQEKAAQAPASKSDKITEISDAQEKISA